MPVIIQFKKKRNKFLLNNKFTCLLSFYRAAAFNTANKYCYIYTETRWTKPSSYIIAAGWIYLHKNCNETVKDSKFIA